MTQGAGSLGRTVGPPIMAALYVVARPSPFVVGAVLVVPVLAILAGSPGLTGRRRRRTEARNSAAAGFGPVPESIRFVALGAVFRDDELLVYEGTDPQSGEPFYRLLGGGVEPGELSREAVVREFDEELGVDFLDPELVGTFERVFEFDGATEHEVWRVYAGALGADWPYERDSFTFVEPELDREILARWLPVERLRRDDETFYSEAVLDALENR